MDSPELLLCFLFAICMLALVSQRLRVAEPVVFLLGGVGLAYVPGMNSFTIEPQAILPLFLPPLLMEAAYFTSIRDFRRNFRSIMQLAVGLVLVTATAVAFLYEKMVPGATLATGFVLGAIVSPPDAVAASSLIKKLRVPKRITTILEGESLINDAVGLILYQFAVVAVMTAHFSAANAGIHFVWMVFGGLGIGLGIAKAYTIIFPKLQELSIEILSNFVMAYLAYMLAEMVQASGVLSVVAGGLYIGWQAPTLFTARYRVPADAVWRMATFVLNALVFMLIGLHMPLLVERLSIYPPMTLALYAGAVCFTCVLVRFAYVFGMVYFTRFMLRRHKGEPYPAWQNIFLIAYTGMRGVVSLATVLALPTAISWGQDFPGRDLITFLALSLIVFTLVVQGLPLPWIIHKLKLRYDSRLLQEDWDARTAAVRSALEKIDFLSLQEDGAELLKRLKYYYAQRLETLGDGPNTSLVATDVPDTKPHATVQMESNIWRQLLDAEREAVVHLRKEFKIGDDVMHEIFRDLDLMANRFRA